MAASCARSCTIRSIARWAIDQRDRPPDGKQTIAEFAENAEIIQMLRNIGVDFAQGYGVAQPQRVLKAITSGGNTAGN